MTKDAQGSWELCEPVMYQQEGFAVQINEKTQRAETEVVGGTTIYSKTGANVWRNFAFKRMGSQPIISSIEICKGGSSSEANLNFGVSMCRIGFGLYFGCVAVAYQYRAGPILKTRGKLAATSHDVSP